MVAALLIVLASLGVGAAPRGPADFSLGLGATAYGTVIPRLAPPITTAGVGPTLALRANIGPVAVDLRGVLGVGVLFAYPGNAVLMPHPDALYGAALPSLSLPIALRVPAGDDADLLLSLGPFAAIGFGPAIDYGPFNTVYAGIQGGPAWSTSLWEVPIELRADVQLALPPSIRPALLLTAETRFDLCCTSRAPAPDAR